MATPNTTPSDSPNIDVRSPDLAYATKPNIALPIEAQRRGVATRAATRQQDGSHQQSGSATHATPQTFVAPPNE